MYCEKCAGSHPKEISALLAALKKLTEEKRLDIFRHFCIWCGTDELPCFCMRDE